MAAERYSLAGKKLHLRRLSPDCLELLGKAKGMSRPTCRKTLSITLRTTGWAERKSMK